MLPIAAPQSGCGSPTKGERLDWQARMNRIARGIWGLTLLSFQVPSCSETTFLSLGNVFFSDVSYTLLKQF